MKSRNVFSVYFHCFLKFRDISTRFHDGYYETLQNKTNLKGLFFQAKRLVHTYQGWPERQLRKNLNLRDKIRLELHVNFGSGISIGIVTGYGLNGPGIESRWEERFSAPVQTGPGAHPASCKMGTGSFPGVKSGRDVTLTPHPLLVPW